MKQRVLTILAVAGAAFFVACAYWQHNDLDAWVWLALYGLATTSGVLELMGRLPARVAAAYGALMALAGIVLAWIVIAESQYFFDEMGREMMGAFLVAIYMAILYMRSRNR